MSKTTQPKVEKLYSVESAYHPSELHYKVTAYENKKFVTCIIVSAKKLKDYESFLRGFDYVRAYMSNEMKCLLEDAECKVRHAQEELEVLRNAIIWNPKES